MTSGRCRSLLLFFSLGACSISAVAQVVLATLPVGLQPLSVALNPITNKIYVGTSDNTVTVIDGATNNTTTVPVGNYPAAVAVNSVTNKIYVVNQNSNTVTVIDGPTNNTTTVPVGNFPVSVAVNSVTNKIYVTGSGDATVTVIDGITNNPVTVEVGYYPYNIAVNSVTNKIYVTNSSFRDDSVTVIDGATNNLTSVTTGLFPLGIAVNSVTNKIYVSNEMDYPGTVTVIDGATDNTSTVTVGYYPSGVGVDSVNNKIYVANGPNPGSYYISNVTVIDGVTNNTSTVSNIPVYFSDLTFLPITYYAIVSVNSQTHEIYLTGNTPNALTVINGAANTALTIGVGDFPTGAAVNEATDKVYVPNLGDNTTSVIAGDAKLQFVPVTPCRVVDTRNPNGVFGGPPIQGGAQPRAFPLPQGPCNIPSTAIAYALNATVVPHGPLGYLTILPAGELVPTTSTLNSLDGRLKADAAIVQGGVNAAVSVYASNTTDLILDINGYFVSSSGSTLAFFPLTPCRVADTRKPVGDLGGPPLSGGVQRDFPILEATSCNIPSSAQAYSLNFTVVPPGPLGYLTVWPKGETRPTVSTLNDLTGTIVANAAIVPAGTGGQISTYASNNTNLVIDINGYFAPANSGSNPLSLYTLYSCRVLDTRDGRGGEFIGELVVDVVQNYGYCAVSDQGQAYAFNATVVPSISLGYLTLWPDGEDQPQVSTLNAIDGAVTSNMALVPTTNGLIDAYTSNLTQLLLDISAYFAP